MSFEIKKNPHKIAICATGAGWELLPIISDHTLYCLNDYIYAERYQIKPDVLFIMDVLDEKPQVVEGVQNLGEVVKRINNLKIPFVAPYKYAEIPLSEAFPLKECVKQFGLPFFSNTICYMIAYALLKGAKEIELYGVNQAGSYEYTGEKGGVEYWLGVAAGRGVNVTIHGKNSQLLKYKGRNGEGMLYGYFQTYEQILEFESKFGNPIIHRLSNPQPTISRNVRKVNHNE